MKAERPDGISYRTLRECAEQLLLPLLLVFQNSLSKGKLPKPWKMSNITPLYKTGGKQNPLNYRRSFTATVFGENIHHIGVSKTIYSNNETNR